MKIIEITGFYSSCTDYIKENEGFSSTFYTDSLGNKTIGYGFNAEVYPELQEPLSINRASMFLSSIVSDQRSVVEYLINDNKHLRIYNKLEINIQIVLSDMLYNMGEPVFSQFKEFIAYIREGNFKSAGVDLEHSLWFEQVGIRGKRAVFNLYSPSNTYIYI